MPVNVDLASETWERYVECRDNGHLDFLVKADRCDKFAIGKQWEQSDLDALKLARRPALTINKILSTISTIMGEQIANRAEILFRPSSGNATDTIAEALTKVWMQIAQNNQMPWRRSELFGDGLIRSRGFLDVRLDFTDTMIGEVSITNLNSKNVVIDSDAEEYDPDVWNDVLVSKWLTPQDVAILYSQEDADILRLKEGSSYLYGYDSIERVRDRFAGPNVNNSYVTEGRDKYGVRRNIRTIDRQYRRLDKQLHFVDTTTGDMRAIPNTWDRDKIALVIEKSGNMLSVTKKLVKRIRWTVVADDVVLHDDWSPYKHFTIIPYFPFFRYGQTVGVVENLLGSQELLNKVSSQELHVVNTVANSGWKIRAGSLKNMSSEELEQRGSQTGLVLELDDINNAEKITPNATPTGLDRISYKAEEHIKTISNVSDSMQGFDREDVAAKAIAYKQQRGSASMSKILDNLERTDWILARNVLDIVQEYYTEERLIKIIHGDAQHESEELTINQYNPETGEIVNDLTLGEYDIVVTSTPARATMEDTQFDQAVALRELGVLIPDNFIIENSRLQRKAEIIKSMEGDQDSPEAKAAAELDRRAREAEVTKLEAEAMEKMASAELKQAQVQKTLAEAETVGADAGNPEAEMQKNEQEFALQIDKHEHEKDLAEREFALKADEHEHKKVMAQQKQASDASIARAQSFAKASQPQQSPQSKPKQES